MSTIDTIDRGVTDVVAPLLGDRLGGLRELVDGRAGMRVDDRGIEVRRLLRRQLVPWERVAGIELDARLDVVLAAATRFLPVRRVPVVGGMLTDVVRELSSATTRRLAPTVRDRAGWTVATIRRDALLRGDVEVDGGAWVTALLHPALTDAVTSHAAMRHIDVVRR